MTQAAEAIRAGKADCTCSAEERGYVLHVENGKAYLTYARNHQHWKHARECPWIAAVEAVYREAE